MQQSNSQLINQILHSYHWLASNNIFTQQFLNLFILLISAIEPKIKNPEVFFDTNTKTLTINIKLPFYLKWKFHPLLKHLMFFLPPVNIQEIQKSIQELFPQWKILINIL